jgi:type I restriction enzyme S subunit
VNWPRYPKYVSTDTRWLGDVPSHWTVGTFSKFGRFEGGCGFPHEYQGITDQELAFHKVNAFSRASRSGVLESRNDTISRATARKLGATILSAGDLVFAKVGAALLLGRIASLPEPGCIDNNMMAFISGNRVDPRFARYLLSQVRFDVLVNPGAVPSVNEGQLRRLPTAVPPTDEQLLIVDFLDRETSKIDALVDKQNQLIATLRENRTATITHAVTKGLNPDAQMKDSGVAWIGSVPQSWVRQKLVWLFSFMNGDRGSNYPSSNELVDEGVPFINAGHLKDGRVDFSSMNYITAEKYATMGGAKLQAGDILYCLRGSLGKNCVYDLPSGGALASSLVALRNRKPTEIDSNFAYWLLNSAQEEGQRSILNSGSAQPNMSAEDLGQFVFEIPPVDEQRQIVVFIENKCRNLDALIAKATEAIGTLREYRSALITAAVTGKIDIRGAA